VAEVCFPYLMAPPALDILILSQDHQQQMKRSRLVIFFPIFPDFFGGTAKFWRVAEVKTFAINNGFK
jgi:hypothetical protein